MITTFNAGNPSGESDVPLPIDFSQLVLDPTGGGTGLVTNGVRPEINPDPDDNSGAPTILGITQGSILKDKNVGNNHFKERKRSLQRYFNLVNIALISTKLHHHKLGVYMFTF